MASKRNLERRLSELDLPPDGIPEMSSETFWGFKMKCPAENYPGTEFVDEDNLIVRYDGTVMRITDQTLAPWCDIVEGDE